MTEKPRESAASRRIRRAAIDRSPHPRTRLAHPRADLDGGPRW